MVYMYIYIYIYIYLYIYGIYIYMHNIYIYIYCTYKSTDKDIFIYFCMYLCSSCGLINENGFAKINIDCFVSSFVIGYEIKANIFTILLRFPPHCFELEFLANIASVRTSD